MLDHLIFVFNKDFSLVRRYINIIVIIFYLDVENNNWVHWRVILTIEFSEECFEFPRHVDWSSIQKEKYLFFINLRAIHTSTQDCFCQKPIDRNFRNVCFELNKLLKFWFTNYLKNVITKSFIWFAWLLGICPQNCVERTIDDNAEITYVFSPRL